MLTAENPTPLMTIKQVALRLGIDRDRVSELIRSGQLIAIRVNLKQSAKRPTWRIRPEDLERFEMSRMTVPRSATAKRQSKRIERARTWF